MIVRQNPGPVVAKKSVGATTTFVRTGRVYLVLHSLLNSHVPILFVFLLSSLKKNIARQASP